MSIRFSAFLLISPTENTYSEVGDEIEYEIVVTNTGNVTLYNVEVSDSKTGDSWTIATLEVGASLFYYASYMVTTTDLESGSIINVATATGKDSEGNEVEDEDSEKVNKESITGLTIDKELYSINGDTELDSFSAVGDSISYKITVCNTGNEELTNVEVVDDLTNDVITISSLGIGSCEENYLYYIITQTDINNGSVVNVVSADSDQDATKVKDSVEVPGSTDPDLTIDKSLYSINSDTELDSFKAVGDSISFKITVCNTGNVILTNIKVVDELTNDEIVIDTLETESCEDVYVYYVITQADIENGSVVNTAYATSDQDSIGTDNSIEVPGPEVYSSLTVIKELYSVGGSIPAANYGSVGEEIIYSISVSNTGNMILYGVEIGDDLTGDSWTLDSLLAGYDTIFYTTYVVTQSDIDAGSIVNVVSGTSKNNNGDDVDTDDSVVVTTEREPGIKLDKQAGDVTDISLGDVIEYLITVTNTGNVSLTDITVTDDNADAGSILYVSGDDNDNDTLDVGESWIYEAIHTVTESDVSAGYVSNVAAVTGKTPDDNILGDSNDPVRVDVEEDCDLLIPDIFSPNGDDVHDYFQIRCIENYPNAKMLIYSRWGQLVYKNESYGNPDLFDGRCNQGKSWDSSILPPGTYFYILELGDGSDPITGYFYLLRGK